MSISSKELGEIVCSIWSMQLGLDLIATDDEPHSSVALTGSIQISGHWKGAVHVQCDEMLIRRAAAIMFGAPPEEMKLRDMRDALGELTNMTAGNIKAVLPGDNFISLPTVIDGTDYDIVLLDAEPVVHGSFDLEGDQMIVTVLKKEN